MGARGHLGELADEFVAVRAQLLSPGLESGEPSGEVFGVQGAVLECPQVTVDCGADRGESVVDGGEFAVAGIVRRAVAGLRR